jgi:hypothetical protein
MYVRIDDFPEDCEQERVADVQIEEHDLWSLDSTLAMVILAALKKFKEAQQNPFAGTPGKVFHEVEDEIYDCKTIDMFDLEERELLVQTAAQRRWGEILDKMIWSFENIVNEGWVDLPLDVDSQRKIREYEARLQEGIDLFARYFRSLWI